MILGIYGYQDSGKTTLVEDLVGTLTRKGYSVSSVKHTPHKKSIDADGKDTWRHWKAGSDPVAFVSEIETSIIKHSKTPIDEVTQMIMKQYHPDVIVVEGLKQGHFKKVAVGDYKPTKGTVLTNPSLDELVEYVETEVAVERILIKLPRLDCGKCGYDCEGLARAVVARKRTIDDCVEGSGTGIEIFIGENKTPMGRFASEIVNGTIIGMLRSLKGFEPGKDIDIRLRASMPVRKRRKEHK